MENELWQQTSMEGSLPGHRNRFCCQFSIEHRAAEHSSLVGSVSALDINMDVCSVHGGSHREKVYRT